MAHFYHFSPVWGRPCLAQCALERRKQAGNSTWRRLPQRNGIKRQYRPRERKERLADREWGPPAGAEDGSREAGSTSVQQVGDTADLRKEHAANGGGRWARIVWLEDLTNSCRDQSPRRARRAAPATPPRRRWRKRTRRRSPAAAPRRLSWSKLRDEDSRCTTTFPTRPRCAGPGRRWRCPAPRPKCRPHFPAFQAVALPS